MSILVPFNGSNYIIPTPNEIGWGTNLDNYLVAIANGTLQNIGGSFVLSNDVDFGGTNGVKSAYYKTRSANIAGSGNFRLANAVDSVSWRNFANSADLPLTVNSSDQLTFNGTPIQNISLTSSHILVGNASNLATDVAMTGDVAITNAGITSVNSVQNNVITNAMVNSSAAISLSKLATLSTGLALQSNSSTGVIETSSVTNTELGFLSGVTSAIQTQLNSKLNLSGGTLSGDLTFASNKGIFWTDNSTNTVKITAPTSVTTYTMKWPIAQGALNQYLTNDGSGNLSWTNAAGTGTVNTGTANTLTYYASSTNAVSSLAAITGNKALVSNASGLPIASSTTDTELGFVHGVTSAIQTQLNLLAPKDTPTFTGTVIINAVSGAANQLALNGTTGFTSDTVRFRNKNTNSGVSSNAAIIADVESGSLDSDAYFSSIANASGGTNVNWSWGLDGSDSGAFVITAASSLTGTNVLRIDPSTSNVQVTNDLYSVAWTDYSGSSTVSGWASRTFTNIFYKKIGKLVYVNFNINGTSNSTSVTFTLPFSAITGGTGFTFQGVCGTGLDNGITLSTANAFIISGATVQIYPSPTFGNWTNSNQKQVNGQFWYEIA